MTMVLIASENQRAAAIEMVSRSQLPFSLSLSAGKKRSLEQNRLQRLWMKEAEEQGDQTAEEYRGYCKLHCGVPILRADNEEFCKAYDELIRPRPYEEKLRLMMLPLDFPVTRLMTTAQKKLYLDDVYRELSGQGIVLTEP